MLGMYTDLDVLDMYMMDMEMEMDQECLSLFLRRPLGRLYRVPLFLLHLLLLLLLRTLSYLRMMTLDMEGIEDDTYINLVP